MARIIKKTCQHFIFFHQINSTDLLNLFKEDQLLVVQIERYFNFFSLTLFLQKKLNFIKANLFIFHQKREEYLKIMNLQSENLWVEFSQLKFKLPNFILFLQKIHNLRYLKHLKQNFLNFVNKKFMEWFLTLIIRQRELYLLALLLLLMLQDQMKETMF